MKDNHKSIIIEEIKYWKQHKLLPEVYCDFLLALYTNGEYAEEEILETSKSKWKFSFIIQVFLLVLMIPFSILVIYFTQFHFILQLGILILFLIYAIWSYLYFKNGIIKMIHLPLIVLLFLSLVISLFILNIFAVNQWAVLCIMLINFGIWLLIGRKLHYQYVVFLALIGIIITLFYNFSHLFPLN